jgi:hypothetical protein
MNYELARRLGRLAQEADAISRSIESHTARIFHGGDAGAVSIERVNRTLPLKSRNVAATPALAQLGTACRDLHTTYKTAFSTLPPEIRNRFQ